MHYGNQKAERLPIDCESGKAQQPILSEHLMVVFTTSPLIRRTTTM